MINMVQTWPGLELAKWQDTCDTLNLWLQVVGKVRLVQTPWINHSWHVPLYLTPRGLTTSTIPHGTDVFQIDFDFIDHHVLIMTASGQRRILLLRPQSVADFYASLMKSLAELGVPTKISEMPCELPDAIPFSQDTRHASYDPEYAQRFWRVLLQSEQVFRQFRADFVGKVSPIHFFWGAMDLAVTRFSGRLAPEHPGGVPNLPDWVAREAYSHEVSSAGFWPGGGPHPFPLFYSYTYPEPDGFAEITDLPEGTFYSSELGEFVLPYDAMRASSAPGETLLRFLHRTYEAAADLGGWDRTALEKAG